MIEGRGVMEKTKTNAHPCVRTRTGHLELPTLSVPGGFPEGVTQMRAGIAQRLQTAGEEPRQ